MAVRFSELVAEGSGSERKAGFGTIEETVPLRRQDRYSSAFF